MAAIGVHGLVHLRPRAEAGDDDRHPVLHADRQVVLQPVVGVVDDEVDGEGRRRALGMPRVVRRQALLDLDHPFLELLGGRAFRDGMEPTMPAVHCATTRSGTEMMKSGAAMAGRESRPSKAGEQGHGAMFLHRIAIAAMSPCGTRRVKRGNPSACISVAPIPPKQ